MMFWQTWGQNLNNFFTGCNPFLNGYMSSGFGQGLINSMFCPVDYMAVQQYNPFLAFPTPYPAFPVSPSPIQNPYVLSVFCDNSFNMSYNGNNYSIFGRFYPSNTSGLQTLSIADDWISNPAAPVGRKSGQRVTILSADDEVKADNSDKAGRSDNARKPAETKKTRKTKKAEKSKKSKGQKVSNGKKLGKGFLNRVKQVAKNLNCDYRDLLALINSESSLNPQAGLRKDGTCAPAVGLIQFMDKGAIWSLNNHYGLNLTREKIVRMSAIEQLDLVEKTLFLAKRAAGYKQNDKLDAGTLYALVFLPGRANREVLCVKGERSKNGRLLGYYEQNKLDYDKNGDISKKDLAHRLDLKRVDESSFS